MIGETKNQKESFGLFLLLIFIVNLNIISLQ